MNEQIRRILEESGTKTSKIRKLLLLGLSHREIAELLTNGNRGFVWNVYRRMRDEGLIPALNSAPTGCCVSGLDFSFTRKFGVEIEAYNCARQTLADMLAEAGIVAELASRSHTSHCWKLTTDGSLDGNNTFELVSPVLEGEGGLAELEKVCWVLETLNVKINGSCGLHVHMDASDFNITTWQNLLLSYKHAEAEIDRFMPNSRRGDENHFCGSLRRFSDENIRSRRSLDELQVNLQAYSLHGTVEFRQHSGTINFTKIENWVRFLGRMIIFAKEASLPAGIRLENFPFLEEKQKLYYKLRAKKLAV